MSNWTEIWSFTRLGSKLSASVSPNGGEVAIGITNLVAHIGVSNAIDAAEARKLGRALLAFAEASGRDRLAIYEDPRSPDEPHDANCQVVRYGPNHACTCASNADRRRAAIVRAGRADDRLVLDALGSMEGYAWHEARAAADPSHVNPYRTAAR